MQSEDWLLLAQSWPPPSAEGIAVLTPWLGNLSCRDLSHSWPKSGDPESTQPPAWANPPGIGWRVMPAPQVMGWDVVIGRRHHLSDEILSLLNRGATLHIIYQRVLRGPGKHCLPPGSLSADTPSPVSTETPRIPPRLCCCVSTKSCLNVRTAARAWDHQQPALQGDSETQKLAIITTIITKIY